MSLFDEMHTTSYPPSITTLSLFCAISKIVQVICWMSNFSKRTSIWHTLAMLLL